MHSPEIQQTIKTLHAQGQGIREIARLLKISRNSVRHVLRASQVIQGDPENKTINTEQQKIRACLPEVYKRCRGNAVRIQEVLEAEHGYVIAYSTLTRFIREAQLRAPPRRSGTYEHGPGDEMQHDTSPHRIEIGNKMVTGQCGAPHLSRDNLLSFKMDCPGLSGDPVPVPY